MENYEQPLQYQMPSKINERIGIELGIIDEASRVDDPMQWFKSHKNIFRNIASKCNPDEIKEHNKWMQEVETSLNKYLDFVKDYSINTNKYQTFNPPREIFDLLFKWNLVIMKKLDKLGLLFGKEEL